MDYLDLELLYNKEKYMTYIAEHKNHVLCSFIRFFVYNENKKFNVLVKEGLMNSEIYHKLAGVVMEHDESKYSDMEFDAYQQRFFGDTGKVESEEEIQLKKENFEKAWKHHYTHNAHHPRFWRTHQYNTETDTIEDAEPGLYDIPLYEIYHMICDWDAMSNAKGGTVIEWYTTKADDEKADMTVNTRAKLEHILSILYDVPEEELR